MVSKAVQQYIQAGVVGFHIEDQIQNKRCGHLQKVIITNLGQPTTADLADMLQHSYKGAAIVVQAPSKYEDLEASLVDAI